MQVSGNTKRSFQDLEAAEEKTKDSPAFESTKRGRCLCYQEQVKKLKQLATAQNSSDKSVPCGRLQQARSLFVFGSPERSWLCHGSQHYLWKSCCFLQPGQHTHAIPVLQALQHLRWIQQEASETGRAHGATFEWAVWLHLFPAL